MNIQLIEEKFKNLRTQVNHMQGEYDYMKKECNILVTSVTQLEYENEISLKAIELLKQVQTVTRDKVKKEFEDLVSWALTFIFEEPYSFKLVFSERGNLQELNFNIEKPGFDDPYDLLDVAGGGVLDIVSFILRVVLMEISNTKGFLILDESVKHLSEDKLPRFSLLLQELSKRLKRQILFISHEHEFTQNSNFNLLEIK